MTAPDYDTIAEAASPAQLASAIGARVSPSGSFHCPRSDHEHGDRNPSLSINRKGGRTVAHCHGCGLSGSPVQVAAAVWGLSYRDAAERLVRELGITTAAKSNGSGGLGEIIATYEYGDESGGYLYEAVRCFRKTFRLRVKQGPGWTWKLGDTRRVLYHLSEVIAGIAADRWILIVEGEKDVDELNGREFVATCNLMGAGKWRPEYSKILRGANVCIIPDNDAPGREHGQAVARALHGIASEVRILELPGVPDKGGDVSDWFAAGGKVEDLQRLVREASVWQPPTKRPTILIRQELTVVTDKAIEAVVARPDLGVYVRGRNLVTVSRDGSGREKWLRRPSGAPVIVQIEQARMLAILDLAAEWVKWNERLQVEIPQRPPYWVATQILARLEWPYPYLEAVIETPTLRWDGSILADPGWDEDTGLLYEPMPGIEWPTIPDQPTNDDVRDAVAALVDPVRDFPFVASTDRAAYVAAVLTIVARDMIDGPTPMFPIRAPTPGTGKTLLAEVIGLIGTGREPPAMTMTYENEELRKRITSLAMEGTSLVLLDNLSGSLGSDALAAALTKTEWEDRILGASQMVRVPLRAVWLASGNNLGFRRTLGRRVVPIDLDAGIETPEDRTGFKYDDLKEHVRDARPSLVIAALTLLRGFHMDRRPRHSAPRMGSFEAWDDLVRSAIVWAGLDDPAATGDPTRGRGRVRSQADDDTERLGSLLDALSREYSEAFTTADVIQRAGHDPELRGILDVAAGRRGGPATAQSLGATFREAKDRPVGGLALRRKKRAWSVQRMDTQGDTCDTCDT